MDGYKIFLFNGVKIAYNHPYRQFKNILEKNEVNGYYGGQHTIFLAANVCSGDINPIAVPTTKVIANPIPNVKSFGCPVMIFMILVLSDILSTYLQVYMILY
jgi:hypothetical protein